MNSDEDNEDCNISNKNDHKNNGINNNISVLIS